MFIMSKEILYKNCHSEQSEESIVKNRFFGTKIDIVPQNDVKCKYGFTLTEVIVVIVIIAALAIILIPNMLSLMPDDHKIKYKKAFYTIQEVVDDIASECQGMNYNTSTNEWETISDALAENVLNYCYTSGANPTKIDISREICRRMQTTSSEECNATVNMRARTYYTFKTTDGMIWAIQKTDDLTDTNSYWLAEILVSLDNKEFDSTIRINTNIHDMGIYRIYFDSQDKLDIPNDNNVEHDLLFDNPVSDNSGSGS